MEQKLIDICFEMVYLATTNPWFKTATQEEIMDWVASQLRQCGFDTKPCGSSWGILEKGK